MKQMACRLRSINEIQIDEKLIVGGNKTMSAMSVQLQKDVEHKLSRMGIDLRNLDVLVMHGYVSLTGKFSFRDSGHSLCGTDIQRVKSSLYRIPGIETVKCQVLANPVFV